MYKTQQGFTLVELVVVIVLLGILGVTALGKFENLSAQAADAAEAGIASEISSAAAINFASSSVGGNFASIAAASCEDGAGGPSAQVNSLMASGAAPTANLTYAFVSGAVAENAVCVAGDTYICSVLHGQGSDAIGSNATVICAP